MEDGDLWLSESHLHGTRLMVANKRRLPGNSDRFGQWHGSVCLVSGKVLQAAGVRLLLSVLKKQSFKSSLLTEDGNRKEGGAAAASPVGPHLQKRV